MATADTSGTLSCGQPGLFADGASPPDPIPADICAALSPAQIATLRAMLARPRADHVLDYRFSTGLGSSRIYFAFMSGIENRSPERLARDDQHRSLRRILFQLMLLSVLYTGIVASIGLVAVAGLYLLKSALGIDLFPDVSFLHDVFFD